MYIDDIFFLWEHGEQKLQGFLEHLNEKHTPIEFIAKGFQTSINLLVVTAEIFVRISIGGKIQEKLKLLSSIKWNEKFDYVLLYCFFQLVEIFIDMMESFTDEEIY